MPARFRPATPSINTLLLLIREYYAEENYPYDEPAVRRTVTGLIEHPARGRIWIIEVDEETAGYLVLTLGYSLEYRGFDAFIDELYLRLACRGKGLGSQALEIAEAACRELGVNALHLEVERGNTAAQALYREWGFSGNDRLLMTKQISPADR